MKLLLISSILCFSVVPFSSSECLDGCNRSDFCDLYDTAPDPQDCNKFYICDNYRWVAMNCGVGTIFDKHSCTCDFPGSSECLVCPSTTPRITLPSSKLFSLFCFIKSHISYHSIKKSREARNSFSRVNFAT